MPLHEHPSYSHSEIAPPKLLELARTWAEAEYHQLRAAVADVAIDGLDQRHFADDGVFARSYAAFAEKAVHAITHRRIPSTPPTFRRRPQPAFATVKQAKREQLLAARFLNFLTSRPGSRSHPDLLGLDPATLIDCLREECAEEIDAAATVKLDRHNILQSEQVRQNPARLFHLLFARHKERGVRAAKLRPLDAETALDMPPRFIDRAYELDGEVYAVLAMTTEKDLTIAGAVGAHCVGDGGWTRQVLDGSTVILSVSKILKEPALMTVLAPSSDRARQYPNVAVPHETVVTIEVNIQKNACYIGQCKLAGNARVTRDHPLYRLLFGQRVLSDIHRKLLTEHGRVTGFGRDLTALAQAGRHLTLDGDKTTAQLVEGDIIVAGTTIALQPADLTGDRLRFLAQLSNVVLDGTALFDADTEHAATLRRSLARIRGDIVYHGNALVLDAATCPNLVELADIRAERARSVRVDLPSLARAGNIDAVDADHVDLKMPSAKELGRIHAAQARLLALEFPSARTVGYVSANIAEAVSVHLPAAQHFGGLHARTADTLSLILPLAIECGALHTGATSLDLVLPSVVRMGSVFADEARTVRVSLPAAEHVGRISAMTAETATIDAPSATKLGDVILTSAQSVFCGFRSAVTIGKIDLRNVPHVTLDLPMAERLGGIDAEYAQSVALNLPAAKVVGKVDAHHALSVTLDLPNAVQIGDITAHAATDFRFHAPKATHIKSMFIDAIDSLALQLPTAQHLGKTSLRAATSFSLEAPSLTTLEALYLPMAQRISLDLPHVARFNLTNIQSARQIAVSRPAAEVSELLLKRPSKAIVSFIETP